LVAALALGGCDRLGALDDGGLGLQVAPVTNPVSVAPWIGLGGRPRGVVVAIASGPAAAAGVRKGDLLTRINGHPIDDLPSFEQAVANVSRATATQIELLRGTTPLFAVIAAHDALGVAQRPGTQAGGPQLVALPQVVPAAPPLVAQPTPGATCPRPGAPGAAAASGPPAYAVQIPALGIEVADLVGAGVLVSRVYAGSWGERAGLAAQDRIVSFTGQRVDTLATFAALVGRAPAEQDAALQVMRGGSLMALKVMVGEGELETATVPADAAPAYSGPAQPPTLPVTGNGAQAPSGPRASLGALVPKLGMHVAAGRDGVEIVAVLGNSLAERGGLQAGDVLVRVGRKRVKTVHRFMRTIDAAAPESNVTLAILRAGRPKSLVVAIGEGEMGGVTPVAPP
jgi:S1-C subfamily serine protease